MSTLATAIERREWELASLCLLVGVLEAAAALPPDAVEEMLEVLAGLEDEDDGPRGGARTVNGLPGRAQTGPRPGAGRTGRGRRR